MPKYITEFTAGGGIRVIEIKDIMPKDITPIPVKIEDITPKIIKVPKQEEQKEAVEDLKTVNEVPVEEPGLDFIVDDDGIAAAVEDLKTADEITNEETVEDKPKKGKGKKK